MDSSDATTAASPSSSHQPPILLGNPATDPHHLSPALCHLRSQIQIFSATSQDIAERRRIGGTRDPPALGRVGLRCKWCCGGVDGVPPLDLDKRSKGAVTFPKSIRIVHQSVRNFQRYHFFNCGAIPEEVKEEFRRRQQEARGSAAGNGKKGGAGRGRDGKTYWITSCVDMGLVDVEGEGGIRFKNDVAVNGGGGLGVSTAAPPYSASSPLPLADTSSSSAAAAPGLLADPSAPSTSSASSSAAAAAAAAGVMLLNNVVDLDNAAMQAAAASAAAAILRGPPSQQQSPLSPMQQQQQQYVDQQRSFASEQSSLLFESAGGYAPNGYGNGDGGGSAPAAAAAAATARANAAQPPPPPPPDPVDAKRMLLEFVKRALELVSALRHAHEDQRRFGILSGADGGDGDVGAVVGVDSVDGALNLVKYPFGDATCTTSSSSSGGGGAGAGAGGGEESSLVSSSILSHEEQIRSDLVALGHVLCREASKQIHPHNNDDDEDDVKSLRELGFPASLCILISKLLDTQGNTSGAIGRYHTVREVEQDLLYIQNDPDRHLVFGAAPAPESSIAPSRPSPCCFNYLSAVRAGGGSGAIPICSSGTGGATSPPSRGILCGREREIEQLRDAFRRSIQRSSTPGPREIVLVSGPFGVGKTSLVEQLRQPVEHCGGHLVCSKFDELGQVQPMSVVFNAFNRHCRTILDGDEATMKGIRTQLKTLMGSKNVDVLDGAMPCLRELMGIAPRPSTPVDDSDDGDVEAKMASNRFLWFFRLFVRGISSPTYPMVLFLDNMQWADKAVMELVCALESDPNITSLFCVGCYRDTEVGPDHLLQDAFREFARNNVGILRIVLKDFDKESVNLLVSQILRMAPASTRALSDVVHAKTGGNALFVHELVQALKDEDLLKYSSTSQRWEWSADTIASRHIADDCLDLMTRKLLRLDDRLQNFLKKASCLGPGGCITYLSENEQGISTALLFEAAIIEGLMSRVFCCSNGFAFTHGRIQHLIYSRIPEQERKAMHLSIGRDLLMRASVEDLEASIYIIVGQFSRGACLITDRDERAEVAKLCVMAGEKALRTSAFPSACSYFLQGSALLDESDWTNHNYDLSLRLFTSCAEAQHMIGNYHGSIITLNPVLLNAKCLIDKIRAYCILIQSIGVQGKHVDAIKTGLGVLSLLGETFSIHPGENDMMRSLKQTRAMLVGVKISDISDADTMVDDQKLAVMKLLTLISRYSYLVDQKLSSMMACRQVQLSVQFGVSKDSAYAFATFCNHMSYFDGLTTALHYGKISLALLARFEEKEMLARCTTSLNDILYFLEPSQARLRSLFMSIEHGLRAGDTEIALTCANIYTFTALQTGGVRLDILLDELSRYMTQMTFAKLHTRVVVATLVRQCIQNFIQDDERDPTDLSPQSPERAPPAGRNKNPILQYREYVLRLMLACFFRRYDIAKTIMKQWDDLDLFKEMTTSNAQEVEEIFCAGLCSAAMAGHKQDQEDKRRALEAIQKFEEWASSGPHFQHRLALLKAEVSFHIDKNFDKASTLYDDAIRLAEEHDFVHEQALACELAGIFHRKATIDYVTAVGYFKRAKKLYLEWGSKRKASEMDDQIEALAIPSGFLWF